MFFKKVTVVGGYGQMGLWFARYFKKKGFDVVISGRDPEKTKKTALAEGLSWKKTNIEAVKDADFIMVSVPINKTANVIEEITPHIKKDAILTEITSIKASVVESLREASRTPINVISLHPMFGSGAKSLEDLNIIIIPVTEKSEEIAKSLGEFFRKDGAKIIFSTFEEHDLIMAYVLGLPHSVGMIIASMMAESGISPKRFREFAGSSFKLLLTLTESIIYQGPELPTLIHLTNPHSEPVIKGFKDRLLHLTSAIKNEDPTAFEEIFSKASIYLSKDPLFKEAYKRMYKAIEAIKKETKQVK